MKTFIILSFILAGTVSSFAQTTQPQKSKTSGSAKYIYTCTIHPEVMTDKPGKCPKCGMDLVKKPVKKIYTCTMDPDVISDKPGKCPKCGMDLVEKNSTTKNK